MTTGAMRRQRRYLVRFTLPFWIGLAPMLAIFAVSFTWHPTTQPTWLATGMMLVGMFYGAALLFMGLIYAGQKHQEENR